MLTMCGDLAHQQLLHLGLHCHCCTILLSGLWVGKTRADWICLRLRWRLCICAPALVLALLLHIVGSFGFGFIMIPNMEELRKLACLVAVESLGWKCLIL